MRKHLFNFWPKPDWAKGPVKSYIFCVIVALFLVCSCSFSVSKPQKTIALNLVVQESGLQLVRANPELAKVVLEYSKHVLEIGIENFTEPDFHKWAEVVMVKLKLETRLEMKFKEILKLVNIEIELSGSSKEIVKMVYNVIENFVIGIKAER